ncbi:MAG: hypothetical protein Q9191_002976 [Dirinaria sp. TL-2023a]
MNTVRWVDREHWYTHIGWMSLIVLAGGGAYYFAKRSINADRKARHEADMKRRELFLAAKPDAEAAPPKKKKRKVVDNTSSLSNEASADPGPARHAPEHDSHLLREKSKYEASEPYRSRKGDRFS